jgi:phosphoglucosamine mutase
VLVRYSGTENLLRVMVEGKDIDEIKNIAESIADAVEKETSLQ